MCIRDRALHALSALGAFAFGSAFWGAVSSAFGLQTALTIATLTMLAVAEGSLDEPGFAAWIRGHMQRR